MILEESSRKFVTNTHRGLYEFIRLPFGVALAPTSFQRVMNTMLQRIDKAICYIDDILVTGRSICKIWKAFLRDSRNITQDKRAKCS